MCMSRDRGQLTIADDARVSRCVEAVRQEEPKWGIPGDNPGLYKISKEVSKLYSWKGTLALEATLVGTNSKWVVLRNM